MTHACVPVIVNGQNCVQCPAVTGSPSSPEIISVDRQLGWNSSAYSVTARNGDCYVQFDAPNVLGVVTGLGVSRLSEDPRDIPYGFYIYENAGRRLYSVVEASVVKTAPLPHVANTTIYRIERRSGVVRYFVNNAQVYVSLTPILLPLRVITCMYASGDGVN